LVADTVAIGSQETTPVGGFAVAGGLACQHRNYITSALPQSPGDHDSILDGHTTPDAITGIERNRQRFARRPASPHGIKDLQRIAHSLFQSSAIFIATLIAQR